KKISTRSPNPRPAKTFWKILEKYDGTASLINLVIKTGRTHQIRVHCRSIDHPILGDPVYKNKGHKKKFLKNRQDMVQLINKTNRQMLHAYKIRLKHPKSKRDLKFETELPQDMINLIEVLKGRRMSS
ncbi:MAG: RNA pseudouridine synthase, partial [bacterium]|nr:RNA pseudouridine synthase [bacterium]